jgi:hypothetical protein
MQKGSWPGREQEGSLCELDKAIRAVNSRAQVLTGDIGSRQAHYHESSGAWPGLAMTI